MSEPRFKLGDPVRKVSGSSWYGYVVGTYSTKLTPEGYCVESARHPGSVQIYPAGALAAWDAPESAASRNKCPNLKPVIDWLENGCDPLAAAKELRIYQAQMDREG